MSSTVKKNELQIMFFFMFLFEYISIRKTLLFDSSVMNKNNLNDNSNKKIIKKLTSQSISAFFRF